VFTPRSLPGGAASNNALLSQQAYSTLSHACSGPRICELPAGLLQLTSCRRCGRPSPSPPLQSVQNVAARLVSGARRHDHITPILETLHWLPVRQRVIFKTAVLVWKCLHDAASRYLADLCVPAASTDGRRQSRSAVSEALAPGALDSDVYWPVFACWVWPQDLEPTTNCPSITRTVAFFHSSASSRPTCFSTTRRQCWLQLWVSCTHRPALLWLYSEFGADYKYPDSTLTETFHTTEANATSPIVRVVKYAYERRGLSEKGNCSLNKIKDILQLGLLFVY